MTKTTYWFEHKGKMISSYDLRGLKESVKDRFLKSVIIYRDTGYFINSGNRPQQHYNYKPRY